MSTFPTLIFYPVKVCFVKRIGLHLEDYVLHNSQKLPEWRVVAKFLLYGPTPVFPAQQTL